MQAGSLQRETLESMRGAGVWIQDYWSIVPFLQEYFLAGRSKSILLYDDRNAKLCRMYQDLLGYGNCREGSSPQSFEKQ